MSTVQDAVAPQNQEAVSQDTPATHKIRSVAIRGGFYRAT